MGNKGSKSMSGQYSPKGPGPGPGVGVKKKGSLTTNGNGPPALTYISDPPPDDENMNEIIDENVELTVYLPNGNQAKTSMEPNIPMMDLLVNLAGSHKLNPASHSLVVLSDDKWKQIDFKANKTIGLLAGEDRLVSVQIVPRKVEDKVRPKSAIQPFEMTYRFTVNLPHNQKKVLRISPKLSLGEVRLLVSKDKNFDPSAYIFQLPSNPSQQLDDSTTVGDIKSSEINFVSIAVLKAAESRSMSDLAYAATMAAADTRGGSGTTRSHEGFMPTAGEKKAKRSFLSFLGKKDKKFKVQHDTGVEAGSMAKRKSLDSVQNNRDDGKMRPKSMFVMGSSNEGPDLRRTTGDLHIYTNTQISEYRQSKPINENVTLNVSQLNEMPENVKNMQEPPKKTGKKKAAPPPPRAQKKDMPKTIQVEIEVQPKMDERDEISRIEDLPDVRVPLKKLHSRNSSDSSGYHELTLSGAESPDGVKLENLQITLDTASIDSGEHFNGDSGIRDMSPMRRRRKAEDNADSAMLNKTPEEVGHSRKTKKRAPLPPVATSVVTVVQNKAPTDASPRHMQTASDIRREEENEALKAMEEVTMKFNIEDDYDDDDMHMIENMSVQSEDVDIDVERRQRPPTFVAPPPPCEPPPDDTKTVRISQVINNYRIDIGVGDDTTCSSPDSKELRTAMPDFREKISNLAADDIEDGSPSGRSQRSEQGTDSDTSFIIHDNESGKLEFEPLSESSTANRRNKRDRESSEITYEFTVDSVPPEFGNEPKVDSDSESDDEVENLVEEVMYYPAHPAALEIGSPRKIPDLDSPKEHKQFSSRSRGLFSDIPIDKSTPKESVQKADPKTNEADDKSEEAKEFVISMDELSNMDFSVGQSGDKKWEIESDREHSQDRISYRIQFGKSDEIFPDEIQRQEVSNINQEPAFYDDEEEDDFYVNEVRDGVKNKCSELSFSPDTEGEVEHVMEEKSISMIALPAERTPIKHSMESEDNVQDDQTTYASTAKIVLLGRADQSYEQIDLSRPSDGGMSTKSDGSGSSPRSDGSGLSPRSNASGLSPRSNGTGSSPRRDDNLEAQQLMQAQYQQLLQQHVMWQDQLLQNQKLLASLIEPVEPVMLQPVTHVPVPDPVPQMVLSPPTPPTPTQVPPPPPPAAKPKVVKADAKYTKPKQKRFERELDPRAKLMMDIRKSGRSALKKVPVKATHWHK